MGLNTKNASKKIVIVKSPGSSDMDWRGEKLMQIYDEKFETHLLKETSAYFLSKAKEW